MTVTSGVAESPPITPRSRWLALLVLCLAMLMIILDQTIVNVALPAIHTDLGFSQADLAWVVNAYLIAFGGLLLLAGRLGDLLGRKRVFQAGLVIFTLASLWCGMAGSQQALIAARFVQGVGAALAAAVALGMVVTLFPEPRERARAIGIYSFVAAAGASIGLLAGGVLTQALSWHWIFLVNVPIGLVATIAGTRLLQAERGLGLRAGADVVGAVTVTGGLMLAVYTIVKTEQYGWVSAHTLGLGGLAVALLAGFLIRQATAAQPLMPLRAFRSRAVAGANLVVLLAIAGMLGMFFLGVLYLQHALGFDPLRIGLAFLPVAVTIGGLSVGLSARLTTRFGARAVVLTGTSLMAIGLALLAQVPVDGRYLSDVLPSMLLLGVGAGLFFPAVATLAMSAATAEDSGLASGLINTAQQVGGAVGIAVLAVLATSRTEHLLGTGQEPVAALTAGYRFSFGIAAALVLAAVVVAAVVLPRHRSTPPTAGQATPTTASEQPSLEPVGQPAG